MDDLAERRADFFLGDFFAFFFFGDFLADDLAVRLLDESFFLGDFFFADFFFVEAAADFFLVEAVAFAVPEDFLFDFAPPAPEDFAAFGLLDDVFFLRDVVEDFLPEPNTLSQFSENFCVDPIRTTLIADDSRS